MLSVGSDTGVVVERTNEVTDVSAANYAYAKGYDLVFFGKVLEVPELGEVREMFRALCTELSQNADGYSERLEELSKFIHLFVDIGALEKKYKRLQFVIKQIPFGLIIGSIPVSHLFHLQSDLRFLDDFFYLEPEDQTQHNFKTPSFFFVDTDSEGIISEVPEISNELTKFNHWSFHLRGKFANRENFRIYAQFLPFDLMLVTGHGSSPKCREVEYEFESRDGRKHTAKFLEYFQFGKVKDGKIELESKNYPLSFDGVDWTDKSTLHKRKIGHLFLEFTENEKSHKVISQREVKQKSIEGLMLSDGVFIGNISLFANWNNPIIVLNTCGSLLEVGEHFSFSGARCVIGTMWSIYDEDARGFAICFSEHLSSLPTALAFHVARQEIKSIYSKLSYIHLGTLDSFLAMPAKTGDPALAQKGMALRLINSTRQAIGYYQRGWLSIIDADSLAKFIALSDIFVSRNVPHEVQLRNIVSGLRQKLNSLPSDDIPTQ